MKKRKKIRRTWESKCERKECEWEEIKRGRKESGRRRVSEE